MTLLGAPVALFPAVSSLIGAIDPTIFNSHLMRHRRSAEDEENKTLSIVDSIIHETIRAGKAALSIDALATNDVDDNGVNEDDLTDAFLKLHLPKQLRQELETSSLSEALNVEAAQAQAAADAAAAASSNSNNNNVQQTEVNDFSVAAALAEGNVQAPTSNNNSNRFNLSNWFRNQLNGVRQTVQQGQEQAQNFWLGGLRRPQRQNLPENYFVRTPLTWRLLVPYGLVMNFLSWATPFDIPRFLPLADAATYLGEAANPFMGFMFVGSMLLHLAEAGVAYALSRSYGLDYETSFAWFLQTMGFGMFSLQYLLFPDARYMQRIGSEDPPLASPNLIDYLEGF